MEWNWDPSWQGPRRKKGQGSYEKRKLNMKPKDFCLVEC